jgi:hypothetical protein
MFALTCAAFGRAPCLNIAGPKYHPKRRILDRSGFSRNAGSLRRISTVRPQVHLPPIRPQLTGNTASAISVLWSHHKSKLLFGAAALAPFAVLGMSAGAWLFLGTGTVLASIFGLVWYRIRAAPKKLHFLFPTIEEAILSKRSLVSAYVGDFEIAPLDRVNCRVHQEITPVGLRKIAVFVFELRGTRGTGLVQAKFVQSRVSQGACSTLQASLSSPLSLHEQLRRDIDDVAAHKDDLLNADIPRAEHSEDAVPWTLVSCFADVIDMKDVREGHITCVKKDEEFEYWDVVGKKLIREVLEPNSFEKKPEATTGE